MGNLAEHLDLSGSAIAAKAVAGQMFAQPGDFEAPMNYPNPWNPETTIRFAVPDLVDVHLEVFNALGQRVRTLVAEELPAGVYRVRWDGRDASGRSVSSGIYFYQLQAGFFRATGRMLLMR